MGAPRAMRFVSATLLIALSACDAGAAPAMDDAGATADAGIAAPALPTLTPCPAGWREVLDPSGVTTCDPWPASGRRTDCSVDEAHFPGDPGCTRVGSACPADGWPADIPAGAHVLYVDDGAAPGGNGSTRANAYDTITAAVHAASTGDVIAVATGHYDEFFVSGLVSIVGACTSGTVLTSSMRSDTDGVVWLVRGGNVIRNLSVIMPERTGIVIDVGATATLQDVVISGPRLSAIYVMGTLTLDGVVIRDTRASDTNYYGVGIDMHGGASVTIRRAVIENVHERAIAGTEGPCTLDAADLSIAGVAHDASGMLGDGVDLYAGCTGTLARTVIEGLDVGGIFTEGSGTHIDATDLVLRDSHGSGFVGAIASVATDQGGTITVHRAWLTQLSEFAMIADGAGTSLTASDIVVQGVAPAPDHDRGFAIGAEGGASVTIDRALISRPHTAAILSHGAGTAIHATDVTILDVLSRQLDGAGGIGAAAEAGAAISLVRARMERTRAAGLTAGMGASIDATDLVVVDVLTDDAGDFPALGAYADTNGSIALHRAHIERTRAAGIASDESGHVTLDGVTITNVIAPDCAATSCPQFAAANGLVADRGGSISATSFVVDGVMTCGVVVGSAATDGTPPSVDLTTGLVENAAIGACLQLEGYDPERLHHDVRFVNVGVPLQATSYALPRLMTGL